MREDDGIRRRGGLAATHELLADGTTSHRLTQLVRRGEIVRVRQGWYGLPNGDDVLTSAVRVGGRATATTAARALGLAAMPDGRLHVRVDAHGSRLRDPFEASRRLASTSPVCVHWHDGGSGTRHRLSALEALEDMRWCQPAERVVAAADSAIRLGLISRSRWARSADDSPERLRHLLHEVEPAAESYLESIARFRLRRLGFDPLVQPEIPAVGRVDLQLGRVVVELDGWEHHADRDAFENDRRRDAECIRAGLLPLRFTARQLLRHWTWTRTMIVAAAQR